MSKEQILAEIEQLKCVEANVNSKKGVTGTNVAAALFFWPGLAYTYIDANDAEHKLEQRRNHLVSLYNQKLAQEKSSTSHRRS